MSAEIKGDVGAAVAEIESIHIADIVSMQPVVVGDRTLQHAIALAEQIIVSIERMPLTRQAGDTIAMALAVLHYAHLTLS